MDRHGLDPARRRLVETIFEQAIELPRSARPRWLTERCDGDRELRLAVDALVAAHERAEGILDHPGGRASVGAWTDAPRDRRIGPYRVISELGRGGMGVVYLAERDDGHYKQRVAVKLLRASPDAEELRRRFVAERQILASLNHPGIAQLLDGGVAEGQLPYLVMEYVDGVPITTYCDRRRLGVDERIRLFRDVCAAVHYAHQNLVLHRDIKPGNILVSSEGTVKLLDFGIAKLLNPVLGPADLPLTHAEFRPMTPEYASPEQVRGEVLRTPSDVYALGVVLYELLCGRRPYHLRNSSPQELLRVVCALEPERPSVAVLREAPDREAGAREGERPGELARVRGVSPERLRNLLEGDLDAIVMMALRKEASHRYGSAELLLQDLQRYLDGLPVIAHRGSRLYHVRKYLRRHRAESAAAAAAVLSLALGAGVAVRQATVAERERVRAQRALADAEQSLGQSESVTGFLVGLFDASLPTSGRGAVTAEDLLSRGATQLEALRGQPLVQARMLEAMARVHMTMAQYGTAQSELERSLTLRVARLGADHVEVAETLFYLTEVLRRTGRYREADSLAQRAQAIRTMRYGARHPATAAILAQRAGLAIYLQDLRGAEEMSRRALAIRRATLEPGDPLIGASLERHAAYLRRLGRLAEAEAELREAIALYQSAAGARSSDAAYLQLRLADVILEARGDTAQAESLMRGALATSRATLGEDHIRTSWAMGDLAMLLAQRGRFEEAERLARAGLVIQRRAYGPSHPNVADYSQGLVAIYISAGRPADAEQVQRDVIAVFERSLGRHHTAYAGALAAYADIRLALGRLDEAIGLYRRAIDIRQQLFGNDNAGYGLDLSKLARVYARKGDFRLADSLFQRALANQARYVDSTHPDVRRVYERMAERYRLQRNDTAARRYARLALPR